MRKLHKAKRQQCKKRGTYQYGSATPHTKPSENRAVQNTSETASQYLLYAAENCEASETGELYVARSCEASEIPRCV